MKVLRLVAPALLGAAVLLGAPATTLAEERSCRGSLGAVTVDNLRVPAGASCTLNGTYIKGTLKVERYAVLSASRIRVVGNVQGENARNVVIADSRIGGSVQVKQGGGASLYRNHVTQDIQYDAMRSYLRANHNRVGGSIQVMSNRGGAGIVGNRVIGNLQCKSNSPAPRGWGNIVHGSKQDQCRRL